MHLLRPRLGQQGEMRFCASALLASRSVCGNLTGQAAVAPSLCAHQVDVAQLNANDDGSADDIEACKSAPTCSPETA